MSGIESMNGDQRLHYSRQIRLPQVGEAGQRRLLNSRALIIGMGGLGSPAAMYLAAAGTGHLVISDFDRVELSNLQRQIVHRASDIGQAKALSASKTLRALNPDIEVTPVDWQFDEAELVEQIRRADVVLDCSDNFETRFAINDACVSAGTPLVSGAAIRFEGQITTFIPKIETSPCYRCLYRDEDARYETCAAEGVLAPVVGVIGSIQAVEAIKVLLGIGESLCGKLLLFDSQAMVFHSIKLSKDPACPVCSYRPTEKRSGSNP
jgi:molybdopterin/thiamine biosynthesis adenylyltransferase